ncbi:hypothetical protein CPLU01_00182 [Colletotrichum plurivorum]|uniref:CCHC-type domain-containing protein n=1 Tax=Colletotrichum plurivorum TaxID=2175906 RepID=A0A8H6NT53_9PEZI|nr:hypothetical protein CPLU01_00182 [Colletotrichum plurivorum]
MQADAMQVDGLGDVSAWPDDLWQLGQPDIEEILERTFPLHINNGKLLEIYTLWLVKQIPKLGLKSSLDSSDIVRNGCNFLSARNYDKGVVLSAFSKHQPTHLKDYPGDRRQFNYARRDIEINYKKLRVSSSSSKPAPESCVCRDLGTAVASQSTPKTSTSGEEDAGTETIDRTKNRLRKLLGLLKQPYSQKWPVDMTHEPAEPAKGAPPPGYVCKRCGIPGHFIQDCDTNGNPIFDGPPPRGYVCRHCGAVEAHFVTACRKKQPQSPVTAIRREPQNESSHRSRNHRSPSRCRSPEPMEGVVGSARGDTDLWTGTLRDSNNHMNEERIRYIREHTDRYRPEPSDYSSKPVGRGPRRSGANTDPLGKRRRLDSYRPALSNKRSSMTSDTKVTDRESGLSHRSSHHSSEGRLSPWDDIQRPPKKKRRDESFEGGLPWDDIQTPSKSHLESHDRNVSVSPELSMPTFWSTQNDIDEDDIEEGQIIPDSTDEYGEAILAANSFFERFERELFYGPANPDSGAALNPDIMDDNNYRSHDTTSSPFGYDDQSCYPTATEMSDDGEDVQMADAPYGVGRSTTTISCAGRNAYASAETKSLQTLDPLERDPPYNPFVLNLFRGREQDKIQVNMVRRKTAMDMYEDEDAAHTASQMSNLKV